MAWQCPSCRVFVENGRVACPACGVGQSGAATGSPAPPPDDGRRDVPLEAHLRATGFWYRLGGLVGGVLIVLGWLRGDGQGSLLGSVVAAAVCVGALVLGGGLARLSSGARVVAG